MWPPSEIENYLQDVVPYGTLSPGEDRRTPYYQEGTVSTPTKNQPNPPLGEVFTALWDLLLPIEFAGRWSFVACAPECRRLPVDRHAVVSQLAEQFGTKVLTASGIATAMGDELRMGPRLDTVDGILVFVRRHDGRIDVVSSNGSLNFHVPFFALAEDFRVQRDPDSPRHHFYLTPCMADVALIRSLGLNAAPLSGLRNMNCAGLGHLLYLVGGASRRRIRAKRLPAAQEHRVTSYSDGEQSAIVHPVILGHGLLGDQPTEIDAVVGHLAKATRLLGLNWRRFDVWNPSPHDLEKLRFCRNYRSCGLVADFLVDVGLCPIEKYINRNPPERSVDPHCLRTALQGMEQA